MIHRLQSWLFAYFLHATLVLCIFIIQIAFLSAMHPTPWLHHPIAWIALSIILFLGHGAIYYLDLERMQVRLDRGEQIRYFTFQQTDIYPIISSIIGALAAFTISHMDYLHAGLTSSAIVFTVASTIKHLPTHYRNLDFSFYTGIFVGSSTLFQLQHSHPLTIAIAGSIAGLLFVISKNTMIGIGGRLGTFAFLANLSLLPFL